MILGLFVLFFRMVYFFVLSLHHDWIDPVIRAYDREYDEEVNVMLQ